MLVVFGRNGPPINRLSYEIFGLISALCTPSKFLFAGTDGDWTAYHKLFRVWAIVLVETFPSHNKLS